MSQSESWKFLKEKIMTISDQDFEIFAMDTYNRGYGKALIHGKKQIDSAEKLLVSPMGNMRQ